MRNISGERRKITKGMPSAVLLSILLHAALFLLAGMLVVFTVVRQKEVEFAPPKAVERPKMKLKKPKVKVKKSSRPKSTTRIVTKVNRARMPDIQLPEMSGMGDGLGDVVGGFDMLPDLSEPTLFGSGQSIGNDFIGTFYDFKRDRRGKAISVDTTGDEWRWVVHKFLERGWKLSVFAKYYRSPKKLYATNLVVPITPSSLAPLAFGDEDSIGALWMVHYKGELVCPASHTNGITFRFWGVSDEFMLVRVDGGMVYGSGWKSDYNPMEQKVIGKLWESHSADNRKYWLGNHYNVVGDWITLDPGESLDMEILIGDNGGSAGFFLLVEEKGVEYERNRQGAPILPAFKTTEFSHDQLDLFYRELYEDEMVCLTNGPVFCDYDSSFKVVAARQEPPAAELPAADEPEVGMRTWTLADSRTLEAEFINIFGGRVVLKNAKGKICKIPKAQLSAADMEYAELSKPPVVDINFLNNFKYVEFSGGFYDIWSRPSEEWGHCGFQLKQTSAGEYNHELKAEMFVVGKQWRRGKYILLDRQQTTFNPAEQEQRFYEFRSPKKIVVALREYYGAAFGEKYYGYLITVTDARGKIVAMKSSHKWLPQTLENLEELSVGNFFDETGVRTYPDRPPKHPKF